MSSSLYSTLPNLVLGFHGCDRSVAEKVISGKDRLKKSSNSYDWLGGGIYFWENNPSRALYFANILKDSPERARVEIKHPAVIGAIIDLGYCFNLLDHENIKILKQGYDFLISALKKANLPIPKNISGGDSRDLLLKKLDRAVIDFIHTYNDENNERPYDSVRAAYIEGDEVYPTAGFNDKNHIQICIRNPNCIKGYFLPLERTKEYIVP